MEMINITMSPFIVSYIVTNELCLLGSRQQLLKTKLQFNKENS